MAQWQITFIITETVCMAISPQIVIYQEIGLCMSFNMFFHFCLDVFIVLGIHCNTSK
jgi:hypothetical protein